MNRKPRRPAQLDDAQIEAIEGEADVAYNSELAHTSAQALLPMGRHFRETDRDAVAESWVRSPEDSLPGILWRGYLLREWIRRESDDVARRFEAVVTALRGRGDAGEANSIPKPGAIRQEWDLVLAGAYEGDFAALLESSATFARHLGEIEAVWIEADTHPLATEVTRRDSALLATAREFFVAATLVEQGRLE